MANVMTVNRPEWADENESEVKAYFRYTAGHAQTWGDCGEPDEVELLKIEDDQKQDITDYITEKEYRYLENFVSENFEDSSWESKSDYIYDQRDGQ